MRLCVVNLVEAVWKRLSFIIRQFFCFSNTLNKQEYLRFMNKKSTTRRKRKKKGKILVKNWMENNFFKFKRWDGISYIFLYICIPVVITGVSLSELSNNNVSIIYCYISIFISALNGLYDAANRWDNDGSSVINLKVFIIGLVNMIIGMYCIYVVLCIAISGNINCRHDCILLTYFVTIIIAMIDALCCFARNIAVQDIMKEEM